MNELFSIELFGLVNLTSEEVLLPAKMTYDIADALMFTLGAELYSGPDETLFGLVDSTLSAVFLELKAPF